MATNKYVSTDYIINANNGTGNITLQGNLVTTGTVTFSAINANLITANVANVGILNTPSINVATVNSAYINSGNIGNLDQTSTIYGQLATPSQPNIREVGVLTSLITDGNLVFIGEQFTADQANIQTIYIGTDAYVSGNLWVNGNVNSVNSNVLVVEDPMIQLASNNVTNLVDIGFYGQFAPAIPFGSPIQYSGLVRDPVSAEWRLFSNVLSQPSGTVPFGNSNVVYDAFHAGSIQLDSGLVANANVTALEGVYANNIFSNNNITAGGTVRANVFNANISANVTGLTVTNSTMYLGPLHITAVSGTEIGFFDSSGNPVTIDASAGNISAIIQGNSALGISGINGDIYANVNGTSNVAVWNQFGQNTNGNLLVTGNTNTGNLSVIGKVGSNFIPSANGVYSLGNLTNQWSGLYVGNNTIYIGNVPLNADTSNSTLQWNYIPIITATSNQNIGTSGNIVAANLTANANVQANNMAVTSNVQFGTSVNYANGTPAITAAGNFSGNSIVLAGNVTAGAISTNTLTYANGAPIIGGNGNISTGNITTSGNITSSANISGANIIASGAVIANVVNAAQIGNVGSLLTGTLTTNAQPNITSVGVLTGLVSSGTIIAPAIGNSSTTFTGATLNAATIGNVGADIIGNSVSAAFIGNVGTILTGTLGASSNAQPNITSVGSLTSLVVLGNISAGNINANVQGTTSNAVYSDLANASTFAGTVTTNAQPNITSVGTLTSLAVTGNISGSIITGNGLVIANSGNITTAGNISGNAVIANTIAVTGNVSANNISSNTVVVTGNISGNNISANTVTTTGNATIGGNIAVTGNVTANNAAFTGNVSTGNISATTATVSTLQIGNFTLFQSGTKLVFAYDGGNIATLDSVGNLVVANNVTGFGNVS